MFIDENTVLSVCGISQNPSNMAVRAQLYQIYPDPCDVKGRLVQKKYLPLPMEAPSNVGEVYLFRIVEYKEGVPPKTISEKYMLVNKEGKFQPSTFCRIDLTYRSLYVRRTEFDFMRAHDASDAFMSWEESMPSLLRFEHLYWVSEGRFNTFKWKVLTRDLMNGKTEKDRIDNAWNHFSRYSNKSPELVAWEQTHPMGNEWNKSPVMETQSVQRFLNGMKKGRSYYRRPNRSWANQGPCTVYGWGRGYNPKYQMFPRYGWPQQPFVGNSEPVLQQAPAVAYAQPQMIHEKAFGVNDLEEFSH